MDKIQIQIIDESWNGISDDSVFDNTFDITFGGLGVTVGTILDVNNDGKFPFSLTSSIADISEINDRSGSYSTTFEIESNAQNDRYLQHLYYASTKNYQNYDAQKKARILINGLDVDEGTVRIDRVASKKNNRKYNFTFYGNNLDWVISLKSKTFQNLPYLDSTFTYNPTAVVNSWTVAANDKQPLYAYMKRGNRQSATQMSVSDFYPDYYMYDVIREAYKSIGYKVQSNWLEQAEIKKIVTPFFGKNFKRTQADLDANSVTADIQGGLINMEFGVKPDAVNYQSPYLAVDSSYSFPNTLLGELDWNVLTGNTVANFNVTNGIYTAPYTGYYDIGGVFEPYMKYDSSITAVPTGSTLGFHAEYWIRRNGSNTYTYLGFNGYNPTTTTAGGTTTLTRTYAPLLPSLFLAAGETIEISFRYIIQNSPAMSFEVGHNKAEFKVKLLDILVSGETFNWATVSDDKISLLKYVTDVAKVHNLYFRTNTTTRTVYIEPRDNFYNALSTATDWTDRIYQGRQYELKYNSSFYKRNQFYGYAKDSNDKFAEQKTKEFTEELMATTHNYPDKFDEGTTELRTEFISPTLSYEDEFGVVTAHMIEDESGSASRTANFNPRLLYYNYTTQLSVDLSTDTSWTFEGVNYNSIPYVLPYDYYQGSVKRADVGGNLSFKDLNSVNGRFTEYHAKTAKEIVDGMTLYISFLFDFVDYKNLDFRKPIYIDNRYPDIEGYWYIQKVENFTNDIATDFELIQAKNFTKETLNPRNSGGDIAPDGSEGNETNRLISNVSNGGREVVGFNNIVEGFNTVVGNDLEAGGTGTLRMGVHNVDVSTDLFQLGVGSPNEPYSLIRSDIDGNILFNGQLIYGDLYDAVIVQTKTASFTLSRLTKTYIIDTTGGNIKVSLSGTYQIGDTWNLKKKVAANQFDFFMSVYEIDFSTTSPIITTQNDSIQLQYIGNNQFIII